MLADGSSSALLRRDGEVAWWCAPRFDSEPVLWSLLDPSGACARWTGVRHVSCDPTPAAPALSSLLRSASGRVECLDGFVDDALVRLVRALDGPLDLNHELGAGGFGVAEPVALVDGFDLPVGRLCVRSDGSPAPDGGRLMHHLTAGVGEWRSLVLSFGAGPAGSADELHALLLDARRVADEGIDAAAPTRSHPDRARDALRVLEACAAPTGAVVAALTTSLPEAVPGDRQWDYRYCWVRDAALATSAASLLGAGTLATEYLEFALDVLGDDPLAAPPVVAVDGGEVPAEREVTGVAGWGGAQPVRVGNGARTQVQHDALGLFVEAVDVHVQTGGSLSARTWGTVRAIADGLAAAVLEDRVEPSSGIWELREERHLVSEDIGRWLALDRALSLPSRGRRSWRRARAVLRDRVLASVREDGSLPLDPTWPEGPTDASSLMVAMFGMCDGPAGRPLVLGTLERLGAGPYVHRYEPSMTDGPSWDGQSGREGAFLPVSFMAVSALAAVGLRREAHERLDQLCAGLPRLLPEMWDPVEERGLGNVPLVWSHMELARALYLLDAADRRARWGPLGTAVWRTGRYVRLRRARRGSTRP